MAANVTPAERRLFEAWVREGAGPEGYSRVEAVVANNCASCHGPGGEHPRVTDYPELRALALEPTPEGLGRLLGARIVHLAVFPLCLLAVALGYLAKTGPGARRFLRVWAVAICLLDAALWAWRGGRPEHLGLAQATAALVGLTMAVLVAVALRNLWSRNP